MISAVAASFVRGWGALSAALAVFAVALSAPVPVYAGVPYTLLPADEGGLAELLEDRVIDTLQYEQLLTFYALPLSVPRGELVYLTLVFPEIADMIPASYEELSAYQPFDNRGIQRFFDDYPVIAGFEPILRFNVAEPASSRGEVVVGINRSRIDALTGHRARFRFKGGIVSADGGLTLCDSAALWQTRRVDVSYGGVNAHIGNFKRPIPGELALGGFSTLASLMELTDGELGSVAANWLYGGSNTWNGVAVDMREIPGVPAVGVGAFCHIRPGEVGGGGGVDVRVGKRSRVFAGFTGFRLGAEAADAADNGGGVYGNDVNDGNDDGGDDGGGDSGGKSVVTSNYLLAHLYAEYKAGGFRATAETAVPLGEENFLPALSVRLNYRVKGSSAEYHIVSYPADFHAPMSYLKKQLFAEIGERKPSTSSIRKHALRTTVPFLDGAVKLIPELDFTESGGVRRIYGRTQACARVGLADIAVKHASKMFAAGADSMLHTTSASINLQTNYPVEIRAAFQSAYGHRKNTKNTYAFEVPLTAIPSAVITPYIRGKYALTNEYWFGLKSEFHLYKKTWTGVTVETPVNVKGEGDVYVKIASSYSF